MKFFILLLPLLCLVAPARGAALTEAKFSQIVKDVKVVARATETTAPAKVNDTFKAPDLIRTGADSLAELVAPDKTITRVGANTVFSFEKAGRAINLEQGSVLFHSPKGKGGGSIRTKGASAAVLGTTIVVTATAGGGFKAIVLEGKGQITLPNGNFRVLTAGQVTFVLPGSQQFGPQLNINLGKLVESSRLVQGFEGELPSKPVIQEAVERQLLLIRTGKAEDTNVLLGNQATTDTVATVDPVTVQQAVDERKDELAIARATDVTIRDSSLGGTAVKHLFLDGTPRDFGPLGVLNFSGFVGRNITLATSAIDFTPYLGQTDFTIAATEVLKIETPARTSATLEFDLELFAAPEEGRQSLLRTVKLAGNAGLSITTGLSIGASRIGDVTFVSGANMSLQNVSFHNSGGKLGLEALGTLTLNGGGIFAQSLLVDGGVVNAVGGTYFATGDAVVRSAVSLLNTDGTTVHGDKVSLEAQTIADLHGTTAAATTLLNLNAQQDLKLGGGNYSVSGLMGTAQLFAGRDLFMGNATDIQAKTIQMQAGNNATLTTPVLHGFGALTVAAGRRLTLTGGTIGGSVGTPSSTVSLGAGDDINIAGAVFERLATLTLTAPVVNLNDVVLAEASTVTFQSAAPFITGASLSIRNVDLRSPGHNLELDGTTQLNLETVNLTGASFRAKGSSLSMVGGNYTAVGTAEFNAYGTGLLANGSKVTSATEVKLSSAQDISLTGGEYTVPGGSGTVQAVAGRDLIITSAPRLEANTVQLSAGRTAALTGQDIRGFNSLNVSAVEGLTVTSGSFTGAGAAGSMTTRAQLNGGESLTLIGTSFDNVREISLSAMTVNLENVNFPSGSTVNLYSQLGQLAANPNTGAASVPGHVNFIQNVTYNGNPAQFSVGSTINISTRP